MKKFWNRSISVLMIIVMLVGLAADLKFGAVEVLAAEYKATINNAQSYVMINGAVIDENNKTVDFSNGNMPFDIHLAWNLPNTGQYVAGDTIVIDLPDVISFADVSYGVQTVGIKTEAGTYKVDNGKLVITLTKDIDSNATGINDLEGTLNNEILSNLNNGEYKFSIFDKSYTIDVQNSTKASSLSVSKYTSGDTYDNDKGYNYVVKVTSTGNNTGISLRDYFDTDMNLTSDVTVSSSVTGKNVTGALSNSTDGGFSYIIDPAYTMEDGETLTITYSAKVADSVFESFNGNLSVKNTVTVKSNESGEKSSDTTKWLSRNMVSKSAQLSSDGKTVNWTITVNSGNPVDISGAKLSDVLPDDYEFISDIVMTSSKNETVVIPVSGRKLEYEFPDGSDSTYTIRFTTSVDTSNIPVVTGGNTTPNTATLTIGTQPPYESNPASVYIPGIPNFHTKKAASYEVTTIDGKEVGMIHWVNTITVPDPAVCPLSNFVFYDNGASWQQVSQTLREGSLAVSYNGSITDASDYTFTMLNNANTFQINFGNYFVNAQKGDTITISYDTYFDLVSYEMTINNYSQIKLNDKSVSEAHGSYRFIPLVSKSIIQTQDDASGVNKIFKWCVKIDLSDYDNLPDTLTFKDILPENHMLVADSAALWNSQWWDGNPLAVPSVSGTDGVVIFDINKSSLLNKKEASGNFVYLHYDTTFDDLGEYLMGGTKVYTNTVEVYDKSADALLDKAKATTGNITPPENKAVDKRLVLYNDYTAGFVYYAIDVNTAKIKYLEKDGEYLKLTDTLGNALDYVAGSLKVYEDAEHTRLMNADSYSLSYDKDKNELILYLPDETPCYITYTARVNITREQYPTFSSNPSDPNYAGNDVKLEGQGNNSVSDSAPLSGNVAKTSGTINYNLASVSLYKSDIANFANGLSGAEYTARIVAIWEDGSWVEATDDVLAEKNIINNVIVEKTDSDGWISFTKLNYDYLYEITETSAPDGYQVNGDVVYIYFVGNDKADFLTALENVEPYANHEIIEVKRDETDPTKDDLYYEMLVQDKKLPKQLKYIEISKQASFGSTDELSGATLQLKDASGKVLTEWTTGSNSRKLYIYEYGIDESDYDEVLLRTDTDYTLVEVSAPSGYTVAEPITFRVDSNGNIAGTNSNTLVMKDNRAIYINKTDSDGNALSGAKLSIYDGSTLITDFETGAAHKLEVTVDGSNNTLMAGKTYTLKETQTPSGYKKIADITFSVSESGVIAANGADGEVTVNGFTLTVTDKTYVTLKLVKQDTNGKPLSGAEFQIKYPDGTLAKNDTFTTDVQGEAIIGELTYGNYIIVESAAPTGYEIISQETPITLGGAGSNTVAIENGVAVKTITNSKILNERGNIRITKTDRNSGDLLPGAVFTLTNVQGTDPYTATATTNNDGIAEFLGVPYGTYTLTETDAPYGYEFGGNDQYTTTDSHGTLNSSLGVESCTITLDANTTGSQYGTTETFEISATNTQLLGSLSFRKTDQNKNPVSGAVFTLTNNADKKTYTETSDNNGDVVFSNLPYGTYTLTETTIPQYYSGWIKTGGTQVTIDSANKDITLADISNTLLSVLIDKQAVNGTTTLNDAVLGIYEESDTQYTKPLLTWQTDGKTEKFYLGGTTEDKNGVKYIAPGTYMLHEITAPADYKLAADIIFTVDYDANARTVSLISAGNIENNVLVMRDEPVGTLRLLKRDSKFEADGSHKPLDGAVFKLYQVMTDGTLTQITKDSQSNYTAADGVTYDDIYVTDSNGEINVSGLSYGTYIFKEVCAPADYIITNENTTFVLSSVLEEQTVYNTKKVDKRGTINILKTDSDRTTPLEDARFDLYRLDAQGEYEFVAGNTTDDKGVIKFENIPYGEYTVIETSSPKNYTIVNGADLGVTVTYKGTAYDETPSINASGQLQFQIIIDENTADGSSLVDGQVTGGSISISVTNEKKKCSFYVKKTGNDTNDIGLSGASFALYSDVNCNHKVYPMNADSGVVTDADGIAEFPDITYGTYYLKEIKAPDGYEITQTQPIKIVLDDNTANLYVKNTPLVVTDNRIILHVNKYVTGTETTVKNAELTIINEADGYSRVWNTSNIAELTLYLTENYASADALNNSGKGNYIYPGTFILKETKVPDGYLKAVDVTFTVSADGKISFGGTVPDTSEAGIIDHRNLILYDKPCGSVKVIKRDAENEKLLLDGVEFSIYNAADVTAITDAEDAGLKSITPIRVKTTGEDGEKGTLTFNNLPLGTYAIFETSVPDGYLRVSQKYIVDITTAGQQITLPVSNIHEASAGNIKIKKTSEADGSDLSGAVFKLVNVNDETTEVATGQTNADGEVEFTNVLFGTYKIIEVTPPTGYSVSLKDVAGHNAGDYVVNADRKSVTVYLTKGNCIGADPANGTLGTLSVKVTDDILRGNLEVSKVDSKSGTGLSGVEFVLKTVDGSQYFNEITDSFDAAQHKFTTDSNGMLTITDIPFGTYTLEEVSTPANYVDITGTDKAKHTVTIDKDNRQQDYTATTVIVTNDVKTADFTIRKVETGASLKDSDAGLEGAVYNLYSDENLKNLVSTGITEEDGRYTFQSLAYGTYYLKEISAPTNYMVDKNKIMVVIPDDISLNIAAAQDRDVADNIGKGSLVIEKKDYDDHNILLSGVEFELYGLNADKTQGTLIDTKTTGKNGEEPGKVKFDNLDYGYYMVKETGVPAYYMAVTETVDSIPVTENSVDENGVATQVIYNQNLSIQISKRAANTIVDLDGATLGIFANGTTDFETTKPLVQWETSATDPKKIYLGSTSGIVSNRAYITPGTYILAEIKAPEGYLKANPMQFTVAADGTVTLDNAGIVSAGDTSQRTPGVLLNSEDNLNSKNALLVMYDDEDVTKSIAISKKAVNGTEELPDAKLKIVDAANQEDEKISWTSTTSPRIISVGMGKVLQYETDYLMIEETAPQGYKLAESIPFYIKRDGSVVIGSVKEGEVSSPSGEVAATAEGISQLIMRDKIGDGKIFISKRAITGTAELEGAFLEVIDAKTGDVIASWESGGAEHEIAIGITATTLQTGKTYILKETTAPDGYEKAESIKFKINSDETISLTQDTQAGIVSVDGKTLIMIDDYSHAKLNISKRAVGGTEELTGAWLEVYDEAGNRVDRWQTTTQPYGVTVGLSEADTLKPNEIYSLHEESSPKGYLFAKDIEFRVDSKGTITLENPDNGMVITESSVQTLVMQDAKRESATITISKKAVGGTSELAGAKFAIYTDDGKNDFVCDWESGIAGHDIKVGAGGTLSFSTSYILHEVTAPPGYTVADDIRFSVDADGKIVTVAETSEDGTILTVRDAVWDNTISLSKKAVNGTKELKGAKLSVLDETGEEIVTWISTEDGAYKLTIGDGGVLEFGKIYIMREIIAPDGYLKAEDIRFIVNFNGVISIVNDAGELVSSDAVSSDGRTLTMRDAVNPTADAFSSEDGPPKTGDKTPIAMLVILIIIAVVVIAGLAITNKRGLSGKEPEEQEDEKNTDEESQN